MSLLLLLSDDGPNPRSLFAAGEQGFWYDPSDFSTMFQDSAGTTPVTALGQSVGLVLDKRLGLAMGPELISNGSFATSDGWALQAETAISGGSLTFNATAARTATSTGSSCVSGQWYVIEFDMTYTSGIPRFDAGGVTTNISATTGHKYYIRQATGTNDFYFTCSSGGGVFSIDNLTVRELPGNHATQSTALSRPTLQQDATGRYYLQFDGTDDGMATPSIDFTGTDKMTLWVGVRKLSDAARGILVELGGATTKSFAIQAPDANAAARFAFTSTGTTGQSSFYTIAAPVTAVITGIADISGDAVRLRVNSIEATPNTADQGTGNYGNYPLYIGRRGGTTLPFNGRIYQIIGRGAETPLAQIQAMEQYVNSKAGAY